MNALVRILSEREALQGKLEHQALHDPLTGLANRALFSDRLEHAISRAERLRGRPALMMLDLDDFKSINDNLGHEAGDALLISIADCLRSCTRPSDTVARLGGDEFAVLLEETPDTHAAIEVAERILAAVSKPHLLGEEKKSVGISIGISVESSGETLDILLHNADIALYAAKSGCKNGYKVFEPQMRFTKLRKQELEFDLRRALENEEFVVHYQPIVSLESGKITEIEALVRWQHPERGLVPPDEFIPSAEENGLIVPIGRWVLREACRQTRIWHAEHPNASSLILSVNLSSRQFRYPNLVEDIFETLRESGLDPRYLKLEITEQTAVEDTESTAEKLEQLKALGVHIALDDFGTGYSALNYLRSFPVDTLKVDRSFVDGMGHDLRATSIVGAVIALAKSLDMSVTAEGTETAEQLSQLKAMGCDKGQGYYFSRPLPGEAIGDFFETTEEHSNSSIRG